VFAFVVDWSRAQRAESTARKLCSGRRTVPPAVVRTGDQAAAAAGDPRVSCELISHAARGLLVALDGRIHETEALRREVGLDDTASVCEAVGRAYLRWGAGLALHLRGEYAVVIWDGAERRLLAARDPFGVRPLHYASFQGQLCIASDSDQLLAIGVASVPDDQSVVEFLTRDYRSRERSFFRDVAKLPPGHLLTATAERLSVIDYRRPPTSELSFSTTAECHEAFRERFFTAVKRRLSRDRPVLIQLSGGVDSTSIVCAADKLRGFAPAGVGSALAASAIFPGLDCDESSFIDAVEAHVRIPVVRWNGAAVDGRELGESIIAAPGGRIPWSGGTEGFVDIARAHQVTSVFDGSGGDQLGMPMAMEVDELLRGHWSAAFRDLFPSGVSLSQARRVLRWALGAAAPDWLRRLKRSISPGRRPDWLLRSTGLKAQPLARDLRGFSSRGQGLRWRALTGAALAASVEMKQRHAALFGLEVSFPFLDWDLVQFTLAVPPQHWPAPRWLARLHREALRADLPPAVYSRQSKADFTTAMANRVTLNLPGISSLLESGSWASAAFVERSAARRLLAAFQTSPSPDFGVSYAVWAIASLEAWLRQILRYRTPEGPT
jgi:asparagine synthase (glutamine-hydrolysing)